MCSVFGLIDFRSALTAKQKNKLINTLARECEVRGTDATGIAYNYNGRLRIYKRPLPAHRLNLRVPDSVRVVMGHTRMTTQGNERFNWNNHPFLGSGDKPFALAHNGVLWNDRELRAAERLPKTKIETDSYIAVQLLEKQHALDLFGLKVMAEKVEGSFVFTVLDSEDTVWLVKGNNPLVLYWYDGFLLYASTEEILRRTVKRLWLRAPQEVTYPVEGEILKIDRKGRMTTGSFIPTTSYRHYWRQYPYMSIWEEPEITPQDDLLDAAKAMGVSEADVQILLDYGCEPDEIEEMLYEPELLRDILGTLRCSYI